MKFQHVANISGGKDSDCIAGLAADRQQRTGRRVRFVFSDTGHEHDWTYEHIEVLARILEIEIETIKRDFTADLARRRERLPKQWRAAGVHENLIDEAVVLLQPTGIPYLDMVMSKGMFAAGASRKFCTEYLKVMPCDEQVVKPLLADGVSVTQWLGIRADESKKRADPELHPRFDRSGNHTMPARLLYYRPILDWTVEAVIAYHKYRGIPLNPLYAFGFNRVGCFPCINERKAAIAIIARRFPEAIEKLRVWEALCARVAVARGTHPDTWDGMATFFPAGTVPGVKGNAPIDVVAAWALTDSGQRRQANMFAGMSPEESGIHSALSLAAQEDRATDQGYYACTGGMGWCE
jgi:3'-phosphoadenosine 5'-phosphosulfate sulfotransferase (PAPS reductase)/FAD synthetase